MEDRSLIYIAKWKIKDFPHYGILADKRLFNYKTNRFSKKVVRNYSIGFNLDGNFYTIKRMKEENMISLIGKFSVNSKYSKIIEVDKLLQALAS